MKIATSRRISEREYKKICSGIVVFRGRQHKLCITGLHKIVCTKCGGLPALRAAARFRATGSNAIVAFEQEHGVPDEGAMFKANATMYDQDSNYVIDAHDYAKGNTDATPSIRNVLAQTSELHEADQGKVPVYFGETGDAGNGKTIAQNSDPFLNSLWSSGQGAIGWLYDPAAQSADGANDMTVSGSTKLSSYGEEMKSLIQKSSSSLDRSTASNGTTGSIGDSGSSVPITSANEATTDKSFTFGAFGPTTDVSLSATQQMALLKETGLTTYVAQAPRMGNEEADQNFEQILSAAKSDGIQVIANISGSGYKSADQAYLLADTYGQWFGKTYGDQVSAVQLGNEADAGAKVKGEHNGDLAASFGGTQFNTTAAWMAGMGEGVKDSDPNVTTIVNAVTGDYGFIGALEEKGAQVNGTTIPVNFDETGAHLYTGGTASEIQAAVVNPLNELATRFGKPINVTEFNGQPINGGKNGPEFDAAARAHDATVLTAAMTAIAVNARKDNVVNADVYDLMNETPVTGLNPANYQYGLFGPDGQPTVDSQAVQKVAQGRSDLK